MCLDPGRGGENVSVSERKFSLAELPGNRDWAERRTQAKLAGLITEPLPHKLTASTKSTADVGPSTVPSTETRNPDKVQWLPDIVHALVGKALPQLVPR
jgi:hypothetical protein